MYHESYDEYERKCEANNEGCDPDNEQRVTRFGTGISWPEQGRVEDQGAVSHEEKGHEDGDEEGGLCRGAGGHCTHCAWKGGSEKSSHWVNVLD